MKYILKLIGMSLFVIGIATLTGYGSIYYLILIGLFLWIWNKDTKGDSQNG